MPKQLGAAWESNRGPLAEAIATKYWRINNPEIPPECIATNEGMGVDFLLFKGIIIHQGKQLG